MRSTVHGVAVQHRRLGAVALLALAGGLLVAPAASVSAAPVSAAVESFERPDLLGAQLLARTSQHRVLVTGLTSQTMQTWVNPDGSLSSEQATGPVRVQQRDGKWLPVDTTLRVTKGVLAPVNVPSPLTLSNGGDTALVTAGDAGSRVALGWPSALPTPTLAGDRATYAEVAPGVDLVVQALPSGFEQFIVLKTKPTSAPSFQLPLTLSGLSTVALPAGGVELRDAKGVRRGDLGAAVMFDSSDPNRPRTATLGSSVTKTAGGAVLTLTPDLAVLNDSSTVYPWVLDPVVNLVPSADTYVKGANAGGNYGSETKLAVGQITSVASDDNRSLIYFTGAGAFAGKHITAARVKLSQYYSVSCTPSLTSIYQVTQGWTAGGATWTNKPTVGGTSVTSLTHATGGACGAGAYQTFPNSGAMVTLVSGWANGTTANYGVSVQADESSTAAGKYFYSSESAAPPLLEVTYNSYPGTPAGRSITPCTAQCPSVTLTSSATPKLAAQSTDADGGALTYTFEVYAGSANPPGAGAVATGTVAGSPSGQKAFWQVPAGLLTDGNPYEFRVKATDGSGDASAWTAAYSLFKIDTTAPSTPTVASTTYPSSSWNGTVPVPQGTFTFTKNVADADVQEYAWRLDDGQTGSTLVTGTADSATITPAAGWRVLKVAAVDKAGNRSAEVSYSFGASAAVTSPGTGASSQRYARLKAVAPAGSAGVSWNYRLPGATSWGPIPLSAVTYADATPVGQWPAATTQTTTSSTSPELIFDLPQVLGGVGTAQDGAVQLQAVFSNLVTNTTVNDPLVTLDQNSFGSAAASVGPGSVSLLTGNYSVGATDASIDSYGSDLTLGRTFNSRTATTSGLFGPGWLPSLTVDTAGSDYTTLADLGSSAVVTDTGGAKLVFAKTGTGSTYVAQGDAEGLKLVASSGDAFGATTFTLSDDAGSVTTFSVGPNWTVAATFAVPHSFPVTGVVQAGDASATTYSYDAAGRPTRILAPHPTGVTTCNTTFVVGCRALDVSYATVLGNQQISKATLNTFDGTGTLVTVDVACFSYDTNGRLAQAWDPRINATSCGTPVLATTYGYDTAGRLLSVTPAGLAGWTFGYDGPALTSRLSTVTRTHTGGTWGTGAETDTVRYDVPLGNDTDAASGLHPDLSSTTVGTWAQTDQPVTATAVFSPGDTVPAVPYVAGADFRDGSITALNAEGRTVNTASYSGTGQAGWRIDTTEQDDTGRVLRTLSAANRDRALGRPDAGSSTVPLGTDTAAAARMLDTVNVYAPNVNDPDPQQASELDLTDTYGPLHQVTLPDGTLAPARSHTRLSYDTGSESGHIPGGTLRLVVASTTGASLSAAPTATNETDQRTTTSSYSLTGESTGWNLRSPVRSTVYTGAGTTGTQISATTLTDPATSLVTETRMPSDTAGVASGTTLNTYYTAGTTNNAGCVNTAWVKLLCKTAPKAQPGDLSLPGLVTKQVTYDYLLRPSVLTETAGPANGTGTPVTRTTTTSFENAGLSPRTASVAVTGGLGTAVPAQTTGYDTATGLPLTTSATGTGAALTTSYDDFGRAVSFTDADGAVSTTSYDADGRVQSATDPKGTTTLGYDTTSIVTGGVDHRGQVTNSTTTGLGGAFTATFDGGGALRTATYPNGITADYTTDETGDTTKLIYSKAGTAWFTDSQASSIHGQWISHEGLPSKQTYSYDGIGRLTNTLDDSNTNDGCVQRSYAFANTAGLNSNRSSLQTYPAALNGDCQTTTSTTQTLAYDTADRLTPTGVATNLTYDTFGRITTLPAALGGPGAVNVTNGYYSNDLVASQSTASPARTKSWQLDATLQRFRTFTDNATGTVMTKTNHYSSAGGDSPGWIDEGNGTSTRYTGGLAGNLAAITSYDNAGLITDLRFQLTNLHGDLVTTATPAATTYDGAVLDTDEYGNPKPSNPSGRYGWLGGKQRSTDSLGSLTLMGVRLYTPTLGRFLSVDPVQGGNPNDYAYPLDPINGFDLDGKCGVFGNPFKKCGKGYKGQRGFLGGVFTKWGVSYGGCAAYIIGGCVSASISPKGGFQFTHGWTGIHKNRAYWGLNLGPSVFWNNRSTGNNGYCGQWTVYSQCRDSKGNKTHYLSGWPKAGGVGVTSYHSHTLKWWKD